jgi:hypothetical protein
MTLIKYMYAKTLLAGTPIRRQSKTDHEPEAGKGCLILEFRTSFFSRARGALGAFGQGASY